jgi:hypothetical protein
LVSCQALPVHLFKSTIGGARALLGAMVLISKQTVSWALTEADKSKAAVVVIMNVRMIFSMLASNELVLDGLGPF